MTNATMQNIIARNEAKCHCKVQRLCEALRSRPYEEPVWVRDCVAKPRNDAKHTKQMQQCKTSLRGTKQMKQ